MCFKISPNTPYSVVHTSVHCTVELHTLCHLGENLKYVTPISRLVSGSPRAFFAFPNYFSPSTHSNALQLLIDLQKFPVKIATSWTYLLHFPRNISGLVLN